MPLATLAQGSRRRAGRLLVSAGVHGLPPVNPEKTSAQLTRFPWPYLPAGGGRARPGDGAVAAAGRRRQGARAKGAAGAGRVGWD